MYYFKCFSVWIFDIIFSAYFFVSNICSNKSLPLVIFDIDNTIADTWPSLKSKYNSERDRLSTLPIFDGVKKVLLRHSNEGNSIVYMTARDFRTYFITKRWLKLNGINFGSVIIVSKPSVKINLIKKINRRVVYYDDLSYGHETGRVAFYPEIKQIRECTHVEYIGYDSIVKLQKGNCESD